MKALEHGRDHLVDLAQDLFPGRARHCGGVFRVYGTVGGNMEGVWMFRLGCRLSVVEVNLLKVCEFDQSCFVV